MSRKSEREQQSLKRQEFPANFDFRALQAFVITVEQGGMTPAAKVLGITQSAVSQIIAALEDAIGQKLFDRTVRPIVLTAAGQALLRHGERILRDVREAFVETAESETASLASLTIAMPESLANIIGPRLFRRSSDLAGLLRISSGLWPDQQAKFHSHEANLMITEESNTSNLLNVERFLLFTEPYVMIFPKDFELPMELGPHLANKPFIRFSMRSSAGRQTEVQLNRLNLAFPSQVEFDSVVGHATAVAWGLGWGITTPMCLAPVAGILDQLVVKPISRGSFGRRMVLIARKGTFGATPRRVAEECRSILREEVFPDVVEKVDWLEGKLLIGEG